MAARKTNSITRRRTAMPKAKPAKGLHVLKLTGKHEHYDSKKVWKSVYKACYVVHMKHKDCAKVADAVTKKVTAWVKRKKEATSEALTKEISKELHKVDPDVKFMYKEHMDVN